MRLRIKKIAVKELKSSTIYYSNPIKNKGKWQEIFGNKNPMHLELGCGRGLFIVHMAKNNPDINFIAIDINESILGMCTRTIKNVFGDNLPSNLVIARFDALDIEKLFDYNDVIDRIYINFPLPWAKNRHEKRRLTYYKQLIKYRSFLKEDGEIFFKTDNSELYMDTLNYFISANYELVRYTDNIDMNNIFRSDTSVTMHEQMYSLQGVKIKGIIARVKGLEQNITSAKEEEYLSTEHNFKPYIDLDLKR